MFRCFTNELCNLYQNTTTMPGYLLAVRIPLHWHEGHLQDLASNGWGSPSHGLATPPSGIHAPRRGFHGKGFRSRQGHGLVFLTVLRAQIFVILLMVQKSGDHQLRLVVIYSLSHFLEGLCDHPRWCRIASINSNLASLCDLFGMMKWPLQRLSGFQPGDKMVTLNHLQVSLQEDELKSSTVVSLFETYTFAPPA